MKGGVMESQQGSGGISSSQNSFLIGNLTLVTSRTDNSETIAVKTQAGTDPSASDPAYLAFQDGTGGFSVLSITAALSLTVPSGAPLGATSTVPFRVWLVLFNDAGTLRLGVIKCYTGTAIVGLEDNGSASSTAISGSANSAGVFYTGTAVTSKVYRILGRLDYTLTTAGTWVTAPTIKLFSQGSKLPGDTVQRVQSLVTSVVNCNVIVPNDNTIPQSNEGVLVVSASLTPTAAANVLDIRSTANGEMTASQVLTSSIFRDSQTNASFSKVTYTASTAAVTETLLLHREISGSTSQTTYKMLSGLGTSGSWYVNGDNTGTQFRGGVSKAIMQVEEIMV